MLTVHESNGLQRKELQTLANWATNPQQTGYPPTKQMNMADAKGDPDADGPKPGKAREENEDPNTKLSTTLAPTAEHAKHWAKAYRTGIASGASSVLSTVTAVNSHIEAERVGIG